MSCSCHGKNKENVIVVYPYDQCTSCARKHIKNAWGAWNEFTYEDLYRDYVSDNLRKAADHLKEDYREIAEACRNLAIVIEEVRDIEFGSIRKSLEELNNAIRDIFYAEHPDVADRLNDLKERSER